MRRTGMRGLGAAVLTMSSLVATGAIADEVPAPGAVAYPIPLDRPPTVASLRRVFRGRAVWRTVRYGESDPSFPIHTLCVGRRPRCGLEITLTPEGGVHGVTLHDPSFAGPRGLRVGARYRDVVGVLEPDCIVSLDDAPGIHCDVVGEPTVRVTFTSPGIDDVRDRTSEVPTAAELDAARVVQLYWSAPEGN